MLYIFLPAGLSFLIGLGIGSHDFLPTQRGKSPDPPGQYTVPLSTFRLPDSISFCGEKVPLEIPDVRRRMEWAFYTQFSDGQIILDLKRSGEYFPYIEEKLQDMGMPSDLKYLPVAESALRNLVSDMGAAGIWQFTRGAAVHYGLTVNDYVDERYNFHKATIAALKYLSDLHARFGTWSLAAAAYNMGSNGLAESINYQHADSYYDLYLNDETSRFVFRIVALKQIMSHYKEYGFDLTPEDFYQPPETRLVVVTSIPNVASWSLSQGSNYKEVKELNPWISGGILPFGTWAVELPEYAQPILFTSPSSSEQGMLSSPDTLSVPPTSRVVAYVVKIGDTLDRIAARFGVSVSDVARWNNLSYRGFIRPGQKLLIHVDQQESQR